MDGLLVAAAILRDRKAYESLKGISLDLEALPEAASAVVRACNEYYERDPDAKSVSVDVLQHQIVRRYGEGDVARSIMEFVAQFPEDTSSVNVIEEIRLNKLRQIETVLAGMLATGDTGDEFTRLLGRRAELSIAKSEEQDSFRLTLSDFEEDSSARIPIAPTSLNSHLGGGVLRGHNITVYGRPDSGKSMFALNAAAEWVRGGYRVLYVANEEPAQDITRRLLSNLCKIHIKELRDRDTLAQALDHVSSVYGNWFLFHKAGCTQVDIARMAAKIKPDVIVVDQLKNIAVNEDNRALQLDKLARQVRELGIAHGCVTMSVTQAGESASGSINLGLSDVEWSNTGIPGAADLMIGIGVNDMYDKENRRMLCLPKNKISGKHGSIPVWVDPTQTRFMTKRKT